MLTLLEWLARQAMLFYVACGVGASAYVLVALAARRRAAAAQFTLERELTQQQQTRAWVMVGLFVVLGLVIFAVQALYGTGGIPTTPPPSPPPVGITPLPTATPTPAPTPTPTLATPPFEGEAPTATLTGPVSNATPTAATPTETPAPTATPLPPLEPPNCPSPDVQITAPVAGSSVKGTVEVWGTAQINAFAYYKFEIQFQGSTMPNFIAQFERPVSNGILGYWTITEQYPVGGPHRFRLVAVDIYGNTTNCIIPIFINP